MYPIDSADERENRGSSARSSTGSADASSASTRRFRCSREAGPIRLRSPVPEIAANTSSLVRSSSRKIVAASEWNSARATSAIDCSEGAVALVRSEHAGRSRGAIEVTMRRILTAPRSAGREAPETGSDHRVRGARLSEWPVTAPGTCRAASASTLVSARAVTVAIRGSSAQERDLTEVVARAALEDPTAVGIDDDFALLDDVEAVALIAFPKDRLAGRDRDRLERPGQMLERRRGEQCEERNASEQLDATDRCAELVQLAQNRPRCRDENGEEEPRDHEGGIEPEDRDEGGRDQRAGHRRP